MCRPHPFSARGPGAWGSGGEGSGSATVQIRAPPVRNGDQASGAGVSVATNTAAVPDPPRRAFNTAHQHLDHLKHPGQLEGLVIAIDDFEDFARHVQELVWSAL